VIYFDTAYIAKCYLNEPHAEKVRQLAMQSDGLACSYLGRVEFWSVLNRHIRDNRITRQQARRIRNLFCRDESSRVWTWYPVTNDILTRTCWFLEHLPRPLNIRSADAIHLVSAKENGFTDIFTNDSRILNGASFFGLQGKNVLSAGAD